MSVNHLRISLGLERQSHPEAMNLQEYAQQDLARNTAEMLLENR